MKLKNIMLTIVVMITALLPTESDVFPCGGTPLPPKCPRTIYLAKFAPKVVVIPPAGGPITVPIGVLPFVSWNSTNPGCAVPTGAALSLTLSCTPAGGGATAVIGPFSFPVPVPVLPGAQPLGAPVPFVIPAGTFPSDAPSQICDVVGTYSVTFAGGIGAGKISGTGDAQVCLVEPSPMDDHIPRLDMEYIPIDDAPFSTCRRGDQAYSYYLLANNDPDDTVTVQLTSKGRQAAILPDSATAATAYANGLFAISHPDSGTDVFPAVFVENLLPGGLLPEPDPFAIDPRLITKPLMLLPGEATIVGIATRSFGMCANGSCNERGLTAIGTFSNGDPALACASTLHLVSDVPAKSALCEFSDSLKTGPFVDAIWQPAVFHQSSNPIPHAATFFAGNLPAQPGFRTIGDLLPNPDLFPPSAIDILRLDQPADMILYSVFANNQQTGSIMTNNVIVQGDNFFVDSFFDVFH